MTLLRSRLAWPWWALAGVLALAWAVYLPGLSGGFLFDDFVNLNAIGATGRVDDAATFWRYVTSGTADPFGRPLSLLSFLVDARDWPADPAPFLRTNVLLHLLNGGLLFVLLRGLGQRLDLPPRDTDLAAVLASGLWTLHPFFVSTTLYVVQREAMLPATMTLLGLIAWVHGTGRLATSARSGTLWMYAAVLVFTPLAIACKANGLLLPVLIWVIDAIVLRPRLPDAVRATHRAHRRVLLYIPAAAVALYLLFQVASLADPLTERPWTRAERLLTQGRVLLDYLQALVVPRTLTTGLYNDAYPVAHGVFESGTWLAWLTVGALVAGAFAVRRRMPALATSVLFFFAGHLLESTVVPLELYFEHRNYLPAMLLGWPLALAVTRIDRNWLKAGVAIALVLLPAAITWQRTTLWAQQDRMAWLWAARNPDSPRAQATAAIFETKAGRPDLAIARLERRAAARPGDLQLALNLASARCSATGLSASDRTAVSVALRTAVEGDQLVHKWLGQSLALAQARACPGLDLATVAQWIEAARLNPKLASLPGRRQDLHSLAGRLALAMREPDQALDAFDRALAESPSLQVAANQAAQLASAGCHAHALRHLDMLARLPVAAAEDTGWSMRRVHAAVLQRQAFWETQLAGLRTEINHDLRRQGDTQCAR